MAPYPSRPRANRLKPKNCHDVENAVDWTKIMFLATGCKGEYIQASQMGVRLSEGTPTGNARRVAADVDPISAMQDGVPVLYFMRGVGFEQRVLKVDNRLSFCYVMSFATKADKGPNILVIPLQQIRVHSNNDALEICKNNGISDPNITYDTVVVVEMVTVEHDGGTGDTVDGHEHHGSVHVFIAPPKTLLKERLEACSNVKAAGHKGRSEGREKGEVHPRLDGLRLKEPFSVYKDPKTFELELQFHSMNGNPAGRHIAQRLHPPLEPRKLEWAIQGIEEKGYPLYPTDKARVSYVLREIAVTNSWAKSFKHLLEDDFHAFLHTPPVKLPQKDEETEPGPRIRGPAFINKCCEVPKPVDEDEHSKAHVRALVRALQQGLEFDDAILRKRQEVEKTNADLMPQTLSKADEEVAAELPPSPISRMSRRGSGASRLSDDGSSLSLQTGEGIRRAERRDSVASQLSEKSGHKQEAGEARAGESPASSASPSAWPVDKSPTAEAEGAIPLPDRKSYSCRSIDQEESLAMVPSEGGKWVVRASRATLRNPQAPVLLGNLAEAIRCTSIDEDESSSWVPKEGKQLKVRAFKVVERARVAPVLLGASLVQDHQFDGKAREEPVGAVWSRGASARMAPVPPLPSGFHCVSRESELGKAFGEQSPSSGGSPSSPLGRWPWRI